MTFAGTFKISIPNDGEPHTARRRLHVADRLARVHAVAAHARDRHPPEARRHARGGPTTLLDTDYAFAEQQNYPIADT